MLLKNLKFILISLFSICFVLVRLYVHMFDSSYIRTVFYDVGQGDASLFNFNHNKIIIDGGNFFDLDSNLSLYYIYPFCHIDSIFISHLHADHVVGLLRLIEWCDINTVYYGTLDPNNTFANKFNLSAKTNEIKLVSLHAGEFIKYHNLAIYILWPPKNLSPNFSTNLNNSSLTFLVDYENFELLYTGDLESLALSEVFKLNKDFLSLKIQNGLDILKVPHHGSKTGIYFPLYEFLKPKYCVISVGKENQFSHPHKEALETYNSIGCKILRTDEMGTIDFKVKLNDVNMPISTY